MAVATRLLVLGGVKIFQPVHGYDLRRELLSWDVEKWANVAPGSIYHQLKALSRDGLLEVTGTTQQPGRPARTEYSLTVDGDVAFSGLLREAWWKVSNDPADILAALAFMPLMSRAELIAALDNRIAALEGVVRSGEFARDEFVRLRESSVQPVYIPEHVVEIFSLQSGRLRGEVDWARSLRDKLRRGAYTCAGDGGDRTGPGGKTSG